MTKAKKQNKTWLWVLIAVVILLFLFSCSRMMFSNGRYVADPSSPSGNMKAPVKTQPSQPLAPEQGKMLQLIFDYDRVKKYTYRSTSYLDNNKTAVSTFNVQVNEEEHNGTDTWHVVSWMEIETIDPNIKGYNEMWFDKKTQECVDTRNVVDNYGKLTFSSALCGPTIVTGNPATQWPYIRSTKITLPLGTFETDMYGMEGAVIYFMNDDVPVPVMMTWGKGTPGPGTIYYELASYS